VTSNALKIEVKGEGEKALTPQQGMAEMTRQAREQRK
jgi:hypothetical protein